MSLKKQFMKGQPVCKVTFSLPTEAVQNAREVRVVGDFNNWKWEDGTPMKKRNGEYSCSVVLKKNGQFQFRYLLDNGRWENDWEADSYVPNVFGVENCVVYT